MFARMATVAAVFAVGVLGTTAPASAATITYRTGTAAPVTYRCSPPSLPPQYATVEARFDAPDSVPSGSTFTPTGVGGSVTFSPETHEQFAKAGWDGIRGDAFLFFRTTGATLSPTAANYLNVPDTLFPAGGPMVIPFAQSGATTVPAITAGAPGSATVATAELLFDAEFHRQATNQWVSITMACYLHPTVPQNPVFSPSITVS
ncbi:DUF6801 domain-containing protein [Amycolatopsis sp. 195334CR]|uniref:DUF6801 domain-containing protein n=1 Tax=Amycolatopsis sp. 195334CR TaxID=2814588 RepID=UPI001A8C4859|nr:DUF6801 domain-containing protein [Amycolatopsis sp. 195334CR]MBN6042162.1 hypothetical protein [Amycolatopsis sp. 195334CR]